MAAYIIADVSIQDPDRYEEYKRKVPPTIAAYGGRFLVRGGALERLEGKRDHGRVVILEFPSVERARAWWSSAEYGPAKALRQACADADLILVDGV
ncbi:MAG TPA: DUF1330 domain-containing protein [Gemmatimonadota bacterium]|jgi:uncharacterized protein (DUF1330 family)